MCFYLVFKLENLQTIIYDDNERKICLKKEDFFLFIIKNIKYFIIVTT